MSEHQNQQQENNENKESISRFEKMLQSKSSSFFDVDEFERIIDHYVDNLNYNYASQAIKIAIRQHPESMHLKIKKAQLHIIKEQPMEALAVLKQIDDQSGTNFDLVFLKGNAFNQLGQYDSAIVCFNELLGQPLSDVPNVLFRISVSFINQGQYDLSLLYLQKGRELDPYDINLLFESDFCHQQKEEFDRSIEFYNRYLDEYPFNDIVWINLAIAYNELEQFDKASDACDYAIALDEKFGMAWFHKANAFAGKQEFEQAIVFYSQCLSCDTEEDAEVH